MKNNIDYVSVDGVVNRYEIEGKLTMSKIKEYLGTDILEVVNLGEDLKIILDGLGKSKELPINYLVS